MRVFPSSILFIKNLGTFPININFGRCDGVKAEILYSCTSVLFYNSMVCSCWNSVVLYYGRSIAKVFFSAYKASFSWEMSLWLKLTFVHILSAVCLYELGYKAFLLYMPVVISLPFCILARWFIQAYSKLNVLGIPGNGLCIQGSFVSKFQSCMCIICPESWSFMF